MKKVLEYIYDDFIARNPQLPKQSKEQSLQEKTTHEAIFKTLSKEQIPLFNDFVDALTEGTCATNREMYYYGFKSGVSLMIEAFIED